MDDVERSQSARWAGMRKVVDGPLPDIAARLSMFLGAKSHEALVIFTRECTGRPRKVAGNKDIVDRVTIEELEEIKRSLDLGTSCDEEVALAGSTHRVWAVRDPSDILLVMIPKTSRSGGLDLE